MSRIPKKARFIQETIKNNPYIGNCTDTGIYKFEQDNYILEYRILGTQTGTPDIEWLTIKRQLSYPERILWGCLAPLKTFCRYSGLTYLRRSPIVLIILIGLITLVYFTPVTTLVEMTAGYVTGLPKEDVKYDGTGWLRFTYPYTNSSTGEKQPIYYYANLLDWTGLTPQERWPERTVAFAQKDPSGFLWVKLAWDEITDPHDSEKLWSKWDWEKER